MVEDLETFHLDEKRPGHVGDVYDWPVSFMVSLCLQAVVNRYPDTEPQQASKCFQTSVCTTSCNDM